MSIELLYIMIFLLGILFVNEHFISKNLQKELLHVSYMKEVAIIIGDEAMNQIIELDGEVCRLRKQLDDRKQNAQEA